MLSLAAFVASDDLKNLLFLEFGATVRFAVAWGRLATERSIGMALVLRSSDVFEIG
jgi:hypothetical protein